MTQKIHGMLYPIRQVYNEDNVWVCSAGSDISLSTSNRPLEQFMSMMSMYDKDKKLKPRTTYSHLVTKLFDVA